MLVHEAFNVRWGDELASEELASRVRCTLQTLPRAVSDAMNSEVHCMWQRLTHVCFQAGLGGDPNMRLPQAMWRKAFDAAPLDGGGKQVITMIEEYCATQTPDDQLVACARRLAGEPVPAVCADDVGAAERVIAECMRGWRLAPMAGCVVRLQRACVLLGACSCTARPGRGCAARVAACGHRAAGALANSRQHARLACASARRVRA